MTEPPATTVTQPPAEPHTLREQIIARIAELGLSIARVAELSGVSVNHLFCYVARRKDMTGQKLDRVLAALGLVVAPAKKGKK